MIVKPKFFFQKGMEYIGKTYILTLKYNDSNKRQFHSFFKIDPFTCGTIWNKIYKLVPDLFYYHLLWALLFMKLYSSEALLCKQVGTTEKTYREKVWKIIAAISSLKPKIIKLENRFKMQNGSCCLMSVDGTDFRIREPKPFWSGWYSHKFRGPGLRYEVALCIQTGHIVWTNGPFAAGHWSDLKIFRTWLKHYLLPDKRVETDGGYAVFGRKDDKCDRPHDYCYTMDQYYAKTNVRARQETVNRRFKEFNILHDVFRHKKEKHGIVFDAIAVITQLTIENGNKLYDVHYRTYNV
ncbi:hypothetical protein CTEN210_07141 [Chaetoceros tenuissimus]|uniref:DDE Tnp4 domain-containing protein n=1 Tax=Chaetoceros tenuissimus TaxID=426638 RepID=A0AAD3CT80_9STRA|nr:hypothetical protein CTEN210_07141 [Chaetoceros tenuissimus]